MNKSLCLALLVFVLVAIQPSASRAQTASQPAVKITGEVITPLTFHEADTSDYQRTAVIRKDRDGKDHQYSGVLLSAILSKAGVTLGKDLRGENLTKFVLAEASDGYQVIFSLAELDNEFNDHTVILADKMDGKSLPPADGPFRIIVKHDKKPARCIKQLTSLKIGFAK